MKKPNKKLHCVCVDTYPVAAFIDNNTNEAFFAPDMREV